MGGITCPPFDFGGHEEEHSARQLEGYVSGRTDELVGGGVDLRLCCDSDGTLADGAVAWRGREGVGHGTGPGGTRHCVTARGHDVTWMATQYRCATGLGRC